MNETDFASYADDNTAYVVGNNIEDVIIKLQNASLAISFVAQMAKST